MDNQEAYNQWASTYNAVINRTRDLELIAKKQVLEGLQFHAVLELGCGTGKNTAWLSEQAGAVTCVDFSAKMLAKAREKIQDGRVTFIQADITKPWTFAAQRSFDLITCSLVLEHISELSSIFESAAGALANGGHFYIGELHPFKQYSGSKARFEKEDTIHVLDCYPHHVSEFTELAVKYGFAIVRLQEWFDEGKDGIPRILTLLLRKN